MPSVTIAPELVRALVGDLVDGEAVSKMGPDVSDVHVPGLTPVRLRRRKPVSKAIPLKALRMGRLRSAKRVFGAPLGDPAAHAAMGQATKVAQATAARSATRPVVTAPIAGQVNDVTAGASHNVAGAIHNGQADRHALGQLFGSTTGKVAGAGVLGTAYMSGKARANKQNAGGGGYDVYKLDDRQKRQLTAGASAVGATAGLGGLAYGAHDIRAGRRLARAAGTKYRIPLKTKALIPLEIAGLGGEISATHILHGDTKRAKPGEVTAAKADTVDVDIAGTFSKFDDDKRRAYGWASVVTMDGEPVVDRQGDYIGLDDIEEAAYAYVRKSRVAGDMHRRTHDDQPHKAGELIESVVFTPDKCHSMGLPASFAGKWWMGVQVEDDEVWAEVKKGNRTGFSIHGKGIRKDTTLDEIRAGR